eukprot:scaffold212711_cov30-Tisochrysis_lutea.AAC.1
MGRSVFLGGPRPRPPPPDEETRFQPAARASTGSVAGPSRASRLSSERIGGAVALLGPLSSSLVNVRPDCSCSHRRREER